MLPVHVPEGGNNSAMGVKLHRRIERRRSLRRYKLEVPLDLLFPCRLPQRPAGEETVASESPYPRFNRLVPAVRAEG
jgi:hypothetical protein